MRRVPRWRVAVSVFALAGGGFGCLLEQDLGHDEPAMADAAEAADLTMPAPADLSVPPDLAMRPDHPDLACPRELTFCDGLCKNLASDPQRCGTCDNHCAANSICTRGLCEPCPVG